MKYKTRTKLAAIPAALTIASIPLTAQDLNQNVSNAASKVDVSGSYLELNRIDGDIDYFTPYLQLIAEVARKNGEDIPEEFDASKLVSALGLHTLKASAMSNTNLGDIWHNQIYIEADPSAGLFSLYGEKNSNFVTPKMSPVGTDIALELDLDLRKLTEIAREIGISIGKKDEVEAELTKEIPELGMTVADIIGKTNVKFSLAIDIDENSKIALDEATQFDRPRVIARMDGITWLWDKVGDEALSEIDMELVKTEKDGVTTYTAPEDVKEMFQGYDPRLIIDRNKDHIWFVSSPEFLARSNTAGQQLADDPEFKATWKGLPESGNSMIYISKGFLNKLNELYATAEKEGLLEDEDFQKAKPLVDKVIADVAKSKNGFAFSIVNDGAGLHFANKTPFPGKYGRYLQSLAPLLAGKNSYEYELEQLEEAEDAVE